ncbi:LOW QUALITY PROTEIN: sialic acid-binding Ig-like lectin 11 [Pangshura tecta]
MGRALPPHQDAGERELSDQGPPWRAGGPATLRVLILALLWRGSLSQPPGFTLTVPQSVSVPEGLCVLVPCTFTYPASYDTDNPSAQLYGKWYKEPATVGQDPPVVSSASSLGVSQETQGRFRLTGDPARGDCSLQISDARRTDAGRYFLSIERGLLDHTYRPNSDGAGPALTISVPGLTEEPEIQISPARGLPGTLLAGEPVTVTCTAPGRCSGPPPRVTWTGPFSDTARNVSAQLENGTWAHSSTLSFTPGLGDHGKELVCSVTYRPPRGPSTRRTVRLHVVYPPRPPNITGTLTRNGRPVPDAWGAEGDVVSLETREGDSLSLSCEAGSRAEATLSWAKGNESLSPGQGGAGRLELPNLSPEDAGEYRCWAKNPFGSASRALRVHVQNPPTLVAYGSQHMAWEGDSLQLLCSISSSAPATLGWTAPGRGPDLTRPASARGPASAAAAPCAPTSHPGSSGKWTGSPWLGMAHGDPAYQFVGSEKSEKYPPRPPSITPTLTRNGHTDPSGTPSITETLTRNGRPDKPGPPNTTGNQTSNGPSAEGDVVSLESQEGDSLSLSCEAGSRAEATLSWAKGNESLSPGQGGAGCLELPNLSPGDAGEYRCWAKNPFGSPSRALRVHVRLRTLQITISRANRSDPQLFQDPGTLVANGSQLSAREGDSLRFLCSVTSSPPLRWAGQWGAEPLRVPPHGGESAVLELPNVTAEAGGLYDCWAQSEESSAQGTFELLVEYRPRLGTRLNMSCQRQGPSISYSCSLRSHPLPQLQWQVDGELLAGNGSWGVLQVRSWAQGDETVPDVLRYYDSALTWTGSGDRGLRIFCLGSNPHGSYAALHFDLSPLQGGAKDIWMIIGVTCGLGVLIGLFLLGLCVIKLRGREPAPPSAEAGEAANGSQVEHTASEASVIYSTVTRIPMHHKTPAARRAKGVQDGAAAAQGPLGPGKPDELHYASVEFSRLQRKGGEPSEAPATEYSEIRRK